ncbi:unnamed protein product [Fraxinus pennsylvanica]|uniref:Nucleic acid binding NABP domain-containing protein n=1 Tax=Fraxinus pennsylvanica TaxID=56036 RepID=A0AAD1ZJU4_9LAMI|nr:unnamed protein product [Fraxinus pennsylvanica]
MELLGLQKPYLEPLLQQQYGLAFGKTSNLHHGFFGYPAFSPGMSYPGSPIADPVIPNLPFGPSSPVMHVEQIMHIPSGLRNIPGSFMGGNLEEIFAPSLLYEFKSNKTKCFELAEIAGHVVEFSVDQYGSRFIQQKLETTNAQVKNMAIEVIELDQQTRIVTELDGRVMLLFLEHCHKPQTQSIVMDEILQSVCMLAQDQYGNYVIQLVLEHGKPQEERSAIIGQIVPMSQQKFASNVVEKFFSFGTPGEHQTLVHLSAFKMYTYGKHFVARVEKLVATGEISLSSKDWSIHNDNLGSKVDSFDGFATK